jgi:dTDP-glucose 4,6-dehydratase
MRILVTGGAGFIGSHFIRVALKKNPELHITNLDKLTYAGNLENLKDLARNPRYRFIRGDINDSSLVDRLMKTCQAVIHFAAETHVDRSIGDADPFLKTNVQGTHALLKSALHHKVRRFIQISTDEVYGSTLGRAFRETDLLKPSSPYAASKAAGDLLALSYLTTFGLPVIITRSSNNYGPCQFPEKFIPLFVTNALQKKPLPLYGDGKNVRNWLYVEDNAEAVQKVFEKGRTGEIYNIGGDTEKPNNEVARKIVGLVNELAGMPKQKIRIQPVTDRLGHDRRYSIDSTKAKKQLGWQPKMPFDKGLRFTVEWYFYKAQLNSNRRNHRIPTVSTGKK